MKNRIQIVSNERIKKALIEYLMELTSDKTIITNTVGNFGDKTDKDFFQDDNEINLTQLAQISDDIINLVVDNLLSYLNEK